MKHSMNESKDNPWILAGERYAPPPVMPNALFLQGAVKPLDVSVVIGPAQSGVTNTNASLLHLLLEVPAVLWSVVTLYHSKQEAEGLLCLQYGLGRQPRQDAGSDFGVGHAGA